jgi:adenine-specific DNA-methyltransferase
MITRFPLILKEPVDEVGRRVNGRLDPARKVEFGQYMTPSTVADFMASLFRRWPSHTRLLDPGAGIGTLTEAFTAQFLEKSRAEAQLDISAYEIEPFLISYLAEHLRILKERSKAAGYNVRFTLVERDFIHEAVLASSFGARLYTHTIMNPPYKKIGGKSAYPFLLRQIGVKVVNLYTAFLAVAVALTENHGEIVAIVPRSFCNGTYFRPFRKWLLDRVAIGHIHVFERRNQTFQNDGVLQEKIIMKLQRGGAQGSVMVSESHDASLGNYSERLVPFTSIVKSGDSEHFIHIPKREQQENARLFSCTLTELGLSVSTGPVVDFRLRDYWTEFSADNAAPLLYAHHFSGGRLQWPRLHKKPNALLLNEDTRKWLLPKGWYTITKRFSSKEERRRVVAYVIDPRKLPYELYGFENHLNVIHQCKQGIKPELACGLALFLNSTIVDNHFRNFSGHTQVNATDLRSMRFPDRATLIHFGEWAGKQKTFSQKKIDSFVEAHAN